MADFQKQTVQWFPGHMAKTRRIIKESLTLVDGVVELVDARIPYSSSNPELDSIIKRKPRIVLLNKCDIADPNATKLWIEYYKNNGKYAIPVDCRTGKGLNAFIPTVNKALADVIEKNKARGMENKPLRLMVVGIPNVGKSTFINTFAGRACTKTGNKPGVTKGKQWIRLNKSVELLDTPGILWPKFEDQQVGLRLALIGAIKDEILNIDELALELIAILTEHYPGVLHARYEVEEDQTPANIIEQIAVKRNCIQKGNELDYTKAANLLLEEFRSGKLGKITLEFPVAVA